MKKLLILGLGLMALALSFITPVYALGPSTNYSFPEYMGFEAFESALGFTNSTSYKLSGLPTTGNPTVLAGAESTRTGLERNYYYRDLSWGSTGSGGFAGIVINVGFKYALSDFNISVLSTAYSMNNTAVILPYRDMSDSNYPNHYVIIMSIYSFTGWATSAPNFMRVTSTIQDNTMGTPYVRYFGSLITQTLSTAYEWQRSYSGLIAESNSETYQEQYNNGFIAGKDSGYTLGYWDGDENGYLRGYDEGLAVGSPFDIFGLVSVSFQFLSNVFSVEIFPNFSIGYLFIIPFGMSLIFYFLKWKKGS